MKLPEPVTIGVTMSGGVVANLTLSVSGVMCMESTEFRELTEDELNLVSGYALKLVVAKLDNDQGEVARLQDLLKAFRAKPKTKPVTRGGHELA